MQTQPALRGLEPLAFAERTLNRFGLSAAAVSLAGWGAGRLGWLPEMLEPFRIPVLAIGCAALVLGAAFPALRQLLEARRLRWTRIAGAVAVGGIVLAEAGIIARAWSERSLGLPIVVGMVALGIGLLADAREALQRRSLPPLGIAGTASAGLGMLLLAASMGAETAWAIFAALPLLAFAGVAYFRVRARLRTTLDGGASLPAGAGDR
jgi:hypothetical protein